MAGAYAKDLEGLANLPGLGTMRRVNIYHNDKVQEISQRMSQKPGRFWKPSRFRE